MVKIAESITPGDYVILRTPLQVMSVVNKNNKGPNGSAVKFVTVALPVDESDNSLGEAMCLTLEVRSSLVGKINLPTVEEVHLKVTDGSPYR